MKRLLVPALLCVVAGCSASDAPPGESLGESGQELNGQLSPSGFLVGAFFSKAAKNISAPLEADRQQNTKDYYNNVFAGGTGTSGGSLRATLGNLAAFRSTYGFGSGETITRYYNRGDLGLGREMHCRKTSNGQVACYVTNFSAGPANVAGAFNEFTFGFSPQVAFANMEANKPVATVAMVYRPKATLNKVIFVVYDGAGELQNSAALDRHGINFADTGVGSPGVNFNNHVPSNCLNCHGGAYSAGSAASGNTPAVPPSVEGSNFLPFDLEQFDYKASSGFSRDEAGFRDLNQKVRDVAVGVENASIVSQIDAWYGNSGAATLPANAFNGNAVVSGWVGSESIYLSVVRRSCRGCHITSVSPPLRFDSAADFLSQADGPHGIGQDIKNHVMPHALQSQRLFWQSAQPRLLAAYLTSNGHGTAGADVAAASPSSIVTLDPHLVQGGL